MPIVYLIHLDSKLKHAQHYIGYTAGPMYRRLKLHRTGAGAKMLRACNAAGITYTVVRKWRNGSRQLERALKNKKKSHLLCLVCRKELKTRYKYYVV